MYNASDFSVILSRLKFLTLCLKHLSFLACGAENYSELLKFYFEMWKNKESPVYFPIYL